MESSAEDARAKIDALVQTMPAAAMSLAASATIRASDAPPSPAPTTTLPKLDVAMQPSADARGRAELELTSLLGEGGMGAVWLARQRSLDREVAVKRLSGEAWSVNDAAALLVEARATGALEHPGIVPVHALGVAPDGSPLLVMKRIDGTTLESLIADAEHPAWSALMRRHGDRFVAFVEILSRVADALELAHSRGWIHRDVKPANVIVGAFGETYLLDWGLAVRVAAVSADPNERASIVGTPAFMAPEMVEGRAALVDARTDVYLLGATLHAALTRAPRHPGTTLQAVLLSAMLSEPPTYSSSVPGELADLARQATARDPADRPASAAVFRDELAKYLRHRGSLNLAWEIHRELAALGEHPSAATLATPTTARTLTEARFGLTHALRDWPANELAQRALERTLRLGIEVELARWSPEAAGALFAELASPDETLRARIDAMRTDVARRDALAEDARRDAIERDPRVEGRSRALFFFFLMGASVSVTGAYAMLTGALMPDVVSSSVADVAQFSILFAIIGVFRKRLLANRFGRRVILSLVVAAVVVTVSGVTLVLRHGTVIDVMVERNLIFAALFGVMAPDTSRAMWIASAWGLAAALIGSYVPSALVPLTMGTVLLPVGIVMWESTRKGQPSV